MERLLMGAALRCGGHELAKTFLEASPPDIAKYVTMIRNRAMAQDLQGAMDIFNGLMQTGMELNSVVYNTVLHACVECKNLAGAKSWLEEMQAAGMADIVSYNTMIKAYLACGNFDAVRSLVEDAGARPNQVTCHPEKPRSSFQRRRDRKNDAASQRDV